MQICLTWSVLTFTQTEKRTPKSEAEQSLEPELPPARLGKLPTDGTDETVNRVRLCTKKQSQGLCRQVLIL